MYAAIFKRGTASTTDFLHGLLVLDQFTQGYRHIDVPLDIDQLREKGVHYTWGYVASFRSAPGPIARFFDKESTEKYDLAVKFLKMEGYSLEYVKRLREDL